MGEWWWASGNGLYRFGPAKSAKLLTGIAPKAYYSERDGLAGPEIFRIFEDRTGDIWLSCAGQPHHQCLGRWERATGKWHHYSALPELSVFREESATSFANDRYGTLWIGTGSRLARYRNGAFQFFSEADGWAGGWVAAIHEDRFGALWIASSHGLTLVPSPADDRPWLVRFTTAHGLSGNDLTCLNSDQDGRIFVCTGSGVDQIEVIRSGPVPTLGRIRHYNTSDGLTREGHYVAYRDKAGRLWFGSLDGISRFEATAAQVPVAPVMIRAVRVAGVSRRVSELGETAVTLPRLKPDENNVRLEYFTLNFAIGETPRYQYRLEGADRGWSDLTIERIVNYARLPAGAYRFLVRVSGVDGALGPAANVTFTIDPPLWRRPSVLAALLAVLIASGVALHRRRVRRLVELERIRTRIASDLHDDIGSNLSQIAILSEVALQNDSGGANHNALARIAELSRETVHSISDIVWAVDPQHDRLSDLTNRMHRFANYVFGARNIKLCFLSSGEREIRILPDVRREIFLIFKEGVNNAARHSGCDAVDVEFTVENSWLELRLADNGRGVDASVTASGHGLTNMRRRVHGLGGEIEVASREPGGVSVHVRVPLPTESYMVK